MKSSDEKRYRIIELFALWEERVNVTQLQNAFQINRQSASAVLSRYRQAYPHNLRYDASLMCYLPTQAFTLYHSRESFDDYYQILVASDKGQQLSFHKTGFCFLDTPMRNLKPKTIAPILTAIRNQLRLDIGYASVSTPDYEDRIIAPHSVVYDGVRWHVRAYCEKNQGYRDFVLSRFNGNFAFEGSSEHGAAQDTAWNTQVTLEIEPDQRLADNQKRIIEMDYQMQNGICQFQVRAALVNYLVQRLRLDRYANTGEAQQIVITQACRKAIERYLY